MVLGFFRVSRMVFPENTERNISVRYFFCGFRYVNIAVIPKLKVGAGFEYAIAYRFHPFNGQGNRLMCTRE